MLKVLVPVDGTRNGRFAVQHVIKRFMNNTAMEVHLAQRPEALLRYVGRFVSRKTSHDYHRDEAEKALAPDPGDARQVRNSLRGARGGRRQGALHHRCRPPPALRRDRDGTARKNSLTRLVESSVTDRVIELTPVPVEVIAGDSMSKWERYGIPAAIGALLALLLAAFAD